MLLVFHKFASIVPNVFSIPFPMSNLPTVYAKGFTSNFQCCTLKSNWIWYSSKHSFSTQSPGSPGQPLLTQVVFMYLLLLVNLPFPKQTMHLLAFDVITFHSSKVDLLTSQWFLPISLAMLIYGPTCLWKPGVAQGILCSANKPSGPCLALQGPIYLVHDLLVLA